MKNTYHVAYSSNGKEHIRTVYAETPQIALDQTKAYFKEFGCGDESDFEIL